MAMLRRGLYGEPVRILQSKLGVTEDGIFGPGTEAALLAYQREQGLSADGIAGPDTFTAMGLYELVLLHKPIRGEQVRKLQEALGISADGVFGPGTEAAVKKFQSENGLEANGTADPQMLAMFPSFNMGPEHVAASVITENTPEVAPEAIDVAKADPPPPEPPKGFVSRVGSSIGDAAGAVSDTVSGVGKSIWGTVKSIF
jgi:peptidoglycan hydrolase-like protein with peptidoglycan-binding domain